MSSYESTVITGCVHGSSVLKSPIEEKLRLPPPSIDIMSDFFTFVFLYFIAFSRQVYYNSGEKSSKYGGRHEKKQFCVLQRR